MSIRDVTISNVKARVVNIKKQDSDTARLEYNKFLWRDFNMDTCFNKKILLVDDEKDIVDLIEEVLINDGFKNIIKAYNGLDAISLCKVACPDVVILDIMLPDIDGIE
ncbi:response regulator transcription factor, partial [Clostridioides difficile]